MGRAGRKPDLGDSGTRWLITCESSDEGRREGRQTRREVLKERSESLTKKMNEYVRSSLITKICSPMKS